ncbi:MAG TPA: phosphatase PAP2 family protein [Myxococcota bacterium]|nr:phosphatase PAP2 family protein [Myxococcota bacterium]
MKPALKIAFGTLLIYAIVWAGSFHFDDELERPFLLAVNHSSSVPGLNALMILITDFSVPYVAVLLSLWGLGAEAVERGWVRTKTLEIAFPAVGCAIALWLSIWLVPTYTERTAPLATSVLAIVGLGWAGRSYRRLPAETLGRLRRAFWLSGLSILVAEACIELLVWHTPFRPRPFAHENALWNSALLAVPDEYVRHGNSYVSGHAAALFALLTPFVWAARRTSVKVLLLAWATVHALSRVYVAAHFPYCVLMGSFLGASVATLLVWATVGVNPRARWVPATHPHYGERERGSVGAGS